MASKNQVLYRKSLGLCVTCGKRQAREDRTKCEKCASKDKQNLAQRKNMYKERKNAGVCVSCGKSSRLNRVQCADCAKKSSGRSLAMQTKAWRTKNKEKVIKFYGGVCVCCGESNIGFLTIDHINNDGAKQRALPGNRSTYVRAIRDNYPDDLQVMCWNCNCGRHWNGGVCPHKM